MTSTAHHAPLQQRSASVPALRLWPAWPACAAATTRPWPFRTGLCRLKRSFPAAPVHAARWTNRENTARDWSQRSADALASGDTWLDLLAVQLREWPDREAESAATTDQCPSTATNNEGAAWRC